MYVACLIRKFGETADFLDVLKKGTKCNEVRFIAETSKFAIVEVAFANTTDRPIKRLRYWPEIEEIKIGQDHIEFRLTKLSLRA